MRAQETSHWLPILGLGFGIAVTVGTTIGVWILRTPGLAAAELPYDWAIIAVLLGRVYALSGITSVVELGTMLPRFGGAMWRAIAASALLLGCNSTADPPPLDSGSLRGIVRLAGDSLPTPTRIHNTTDPEVCGRSQILEDIVVSEHRGIRNVIVSLRGAPPVRYVPVTVVMDNMDCRFEPHVAVVPSGSTIEARNSDAILHTTHLYGPAEMNLSLPIRDTRSTRTLRATGIYSVKCDVHGWMQAYVRVDPHPFHAVTDAEGRFLIEGIPPGTYVLEIWHEKLGPLEREVRIGRDELASIEVEYVP